jgi:hypothetical protein
MQCLQKHNVIISLSCDMDLPIFCSEGMLFDMKCVLFARKWFLEQNYLMSNYYILPAFWLKSNITRSYNEGIALGLVIVMH